LHVDYTKTDRADKHKLLYESQYWLGNVGSEFIAGVFSLGLQVGLYTAKLATQHERPP